MRPVSYWSCSAVASAWWSSQACRVGSSKRSMLASDWTAAGMAVRTDIGGAPQKLLPPGRGMLAHPSGPFSLSGSAVPPLDDLIIYLGNLRFNKILQNIFGFPRSW